MTRGPRCTPQNTDVAEIGSNQDDDYRAAHDHARVARAPLGQRDSSVASRRWWDSDAASYVAEHGDFLGDRDGVPSFVWGPEGLTEQEAGLLGPLTGRRVLEVGAGAAQGSRWLREQGAHAVALDLSMGMLLEGARLGQQVGQAVPLVQADAIALPFGPDSFDLACSAYGAVPFVADIGLLFREVARVLRPGGLWVFSVTHPHPLGLPRRRLRGGPGRGPALLRPHPLCRTRRERTGVIRRTSPDTRRPGAPSDRSRIPRRESDRTGVARGT